MANFMKRSGKWQARITWRDSEGKLRQKSKSGFATKQQAKQYAAKMESQRLTGVNIKADPFFSDYFKQWFDTYKKSAINYITARHYHYTGKLIQSCFTKVKLKTIKRSDYQRFINDFGKNHAPETVKKVNSIIRACIRSAVLDGLITKDFTSQVNLVANKGHVRKVEYLDLAEIKRLKNFTLSKLNRHFTSRYMLLTALYTGMRPEEIQALTWNDIDYINHTITINKAWDSKLGKFKPTKNESSKRKIRVNTDLLKILNQLKENNSTMVFQNQYHRIPESNALNKWQIAINKLNKIKLTGVAKRPLMANANLNILMACSSCTN